jgi:hypothetical protein
VRGIPSVEIGSPSFASKLHLKEERLLFSYHRFVCLFFTISVLSFIFVEIDLSYCLLLVVTTTQSSGMFFFLIFKCQCVEGRNMKTAAVIGIERIMLGVMDFSEAMLE